jgi:OOP family OmpA-OmpF porin
MIFPRFLSFVLPAIIILTPAQAVFAQYQALDETDQIGTEPGNPFTWAVQIDAGERTLTGNVPYESVATILSQRAGINGDDGMTIAGGAPFGFLPDAMKAVAASEMLEEGSIAYTEGGWTVSGSLRPDESLKALTEVLGASASNGTEWIIAVETSDASQQESESPEAVAQDVMESVEGLLEESAAETSDITENTDGAPEAETVEPLENEADTAPELTVESGQAADDQSPAPESTEVEEEPAQEAASNANTVIPDEAPIEQEAVLADADTAQCREQVTALTRVNPISFASGRTTPTAASEEIIADIAGILAVCPSLPVYVEGHTDADGRDQTNLVLSLSRAEAVVDRLVEQGIDPQRLFAVGYGESLPVASNQTAAGKAENRRIVFSFEDIAQ